MKTPLLFSISAVALGLILIGCGGDPAPDATAERSTETSPAATAQPDRPTGPSPLRTAPPAPAGPEPAASANRVAVGNSLGVEGSALATGGPYALSDTVYASAPTRAMSSDASVSVYWTYEDGNSHKEETVQVPAGEDYLVFEFSQADGMQPGTYNVQIDVDMQPIGIAEFRVE